MSCDHVQRGAGNCVDAYSFSGKTDRWALCVSVGFCLVCPDYANGGLSARGIVRIGAAGSEGVVSLITGRRRIQMAVRECSHSSRVVAGYYA